MIKGSAGKIIRLKNTDSELFDEALFILTDRAAARRLSEEDMVKEANRIVSKNLISDCAFATVGRRWQTIRWFLAGAGSTAVLAAAMALLR